MNLDVLLALSSRGDGSKERIIIEQLTEIVSYVNKKFIAGKFEEIDKELLNLDLTVASLEGLAATCRYTFCARQELKHWTSFRDKVYHECKKRNVELESLWSEKESQRINDATNTLLKGLLEGLDI